MVSFLDVNNWTHHFTASTDRFVIDQPIFPQINTIRKFIKNLGYGDYQIDISYQELDKFPQESMLSDKMDDLLISYLIEMCYIKEISKTDKINSILSKLKIKG